MILEESSSKGPDTGKDKVKFIKFSWRVSRSVVLCQQAVQQRAKHLAEKNASSNPSAKFNKVVYMQLLSICNSIPEPCWFLGWE